MASMNTTAGTFMFHPRTAVFEHPITYNLTSSASSTSAKTSKSTKDELPQYYISERSFQTFFFFIRSRNHWSNLSFFSIALESRTTIHKSSKGPISVAECDPQGRYIIIENTSRSKSIALAGWTLRQVNDNEDVLTFSLPENCLLRPNHTVKVRVRSWLKRHWYALLCSIRSLQK